MDECIIWVLASLGVISLSALLILNKNLNLTLCCCKSQLFDRERDNTCVSVRLCFIPTAIWTLCVTAGKLRVRGLNKCWIRSSKMFLMSSKSELIWDLFFLHVQAANPPISLLICWLGWFGFLIAWRIECNKGGHFTLSFPYHVDFQCYDFWHMVCERKGAYCPGQVIRRAALMMY